MKRRKDDEKPMGPMFPRLHVNDTEKGGPRAPPRNKMALYEQLSIPSQRFNSGVSSLKPNSNNHASPSSSQFPPSAPTFQLEKLSRSGSSTMSRVASLANNGGAEDDFAVPVFVQSPLVHGKSAKRKSSGKLTLTNSNNKAQSKRNDEDNVNDPDVDPSQDVRSQTATEPNNCMSGSDPESLPKMDGFYKAFEEIKKRKSNKAARLQSENVARDFAPEETLSSRENKLGVPSVRKDPSSGDTQCVNDGQYMSDERSNDGSDDASNVDSVSAVDISPDDVVGIIGQKCFWKARKAIVNQQRVFAVQVFELHRLIKVQKLIAASPNLLLEDALALTKPPSGTSSPTETVGALEDNENSPSSPSPTLIVKEHPPIHSHPTTEFSAENAVRKPMMAANRGVTPPQDTWAGPWGGGADPGPSPNQWLVPMMSPTEGLVYKPCPGPMFGSCGTSALMGGNFPYLQFGGGVPSYHHQQQQQPFFPGGGFPHNSYFPPYGSMMPMPVSVPPRQGGGCEQMKFSEPVSSVAIGENNHGPNQQIAATTTGSKRRRIRTSGEADFQGSTTNSSSPLKKVKAGGGDCDKSSCDSESGSGGDKKGPPLFGDGESCCTSRVIKAVPHNPTSASESVARIFRFIQEERKR